MRIEYKDYLYRGGHDVKRDEQMKYVALGDSLTVGVGASFLAPGFVGRFAKFTEQTHQSQICTNVYAKSGIETGEVLEMIESTDLHSHISRAHLITISAGGNDLIQASKDFMESGETDELTQSVKECYLNMMKIMEILHMLKKECRLPFRIYLLNLYNPLPKIPLADKWVSLFNRHLNSFHNGESVVVADLYSVFKGKQETFLSRDRVHPNDLGYEAIAQTLVALGYPKF